MYTYRRSPLLAGIFATVAVAVAVFLISQPSDAYAQAEAPPLVEVGPVVEAGPAVEEAPAVESDAAPDSEGPAVETEDTESGEAEPATEPEPASDEPASEGSPPAESGSDDSPAENTPDADDAADAENADSESADEPAADESSDAETPAAQDEAGEDAAAKEGHSATEAAPTEPGVPWTDELQKVVSKPAPEGPEDLRLIQQQVRKVVEFARPATVGVMVGGAVGSAIIVSEDGLVLTAGHVAMEPSRRVRFLFADGRRAEGITLGINQEFDSGMMRITDEGPWPFVPIAPAGETSPGDWVVGLGQPNGFFGDRAPPVRLGRVLSADGDTVGTDVTLVGGDSGGPLLNLKGQVVAIHSRIGRSITHNFHVPIEQFHSTWDRLASGQMWGGALGTAEPARYRPLLGVAVNSLEPGCRVTQVFPNMPAQQAGMLVGDVIQEFDGTAVDSLGALSELISEQRAGARVDLIVVRDGNPVTLKVRLGLIAVDFPGAPPRRAS